MTTASDNFDRANETPLASPWATAEGTGVNLSGNLATQSGAANQSSIYNSGTWGNDHEAQGVVGSLVSNTNYASVTVRFSTTGNGYEFGTDGTSGAAHTEIFRHDAGVTTSILVVATTFANGDTIKLRVQGTLLTAYKNGVSVGSVTDATYASGFPGVTIFGAATLDNWSATDDIHAPQHDYPKAIARGIRTGRGGLILRRLRVPLQNWPSAAPAAADEGVYSSEDGDWLSAIDDAGDVDTSSWDWYQDDQTVGREDNVVALGVVLPDSFEWEEPDLRDDAVYLWPLSHAPPIDDDLPQQSIVSDSYEQPPWPEDEPFEFNFWVTPQDSPQLSIVEDASTQLPFPEDDESYGFSDAQDPGDDLPQQGITEDGSYTDPEDEPFGFDLTLPEEPVVATDQPVVEDADAQLEDTDEDFGFFADPLSGDDLPQQGITEDGSYQDPEDEPFGFEFPVAIDDIAAADQPQVEDADGQLEDVDEDFGFSTAPLAEDSPQLSIVEDSSNQPPAPEDDESYGFANDNPLPDDVQSDQVFVELGNTREEDIGDEDFGFTFDIAVEEQTIESNQVFVEDSSDQLPEPEGDEPFDFSIDPTPDDVAQPPVVFPTFNVSGSGRRWYIIKKKRHFFTNEELAYYIARHMIDVTREDIRVTYKTRPDRVVSKSAYQALVDTVKSLEKMAPDVRPLAAIESDDDDDEEAMSLLL